MTSKVEAGQWSNSLMEWFYRPDFWLAPIALTPQFVRIPILTRTAGTIKTRAIVATLLHPPRTLSSNTSAYQRCLPTGPIAFLPLSPTASSLVWSTSPALAAALTKADPAILTSMINAAFRLPELSVRYLHRRPLEIRAEIAFRERAHAIRPWCKNGSADTCS